jgi:very-short-patch-repair endonuclease
VACSQQDREGSDFFIEKNYVYNHNFYMNPYNKKLKNLARANRHSGNLSEALLWNELKQSKLGVRFTKQKIIGNYIADFYCIEKNMVIEIDGWSHDNKYEHDKERDEYMKALGIHVLRISDKDVKQDMNNVLTFIKHNINLIK